MSTNIKNRVLCMLVGVAACLVLVPSLAWASIPEVQLSAEGAKVAVTLQTPGDTTEEVRALQLTLQTDVRLGGGEGLKVEFAFNDLGASVAQSRYNPDNGRLTLYIAGAQNLYANPEVSLGSVVVSSGNENGVSVDVAVHEDGLKVVNDANEEKSQILAASQVVSAVVGQGGVTPTPPTGEGDTPSQQPDEEVGGQGGGGLGAGTPPTTVPGASLLSTGDQVPVGLLTFLVGGAVALAVTAFLVLRSKRSKKFH